MNSELNQKFAVALSFAGDDRDIADELALTLRNNGVNVFYDKYEQSKLWGKDLYEYLTEIYRDKSEFCVILLSENYYNKWTKVELRAAFARVFETDLEYILPVLLDDVDVKSIPGLNPTQAYLSTSKNSIEEIALSIVEKLRQRNIPLIPFPGIYENFLLKINIQSVKGDIASIEKISSMRITTDIASEVIDDLSVSGSIKSVSVNPGKIVEKTNEGVTTVFRTQLDRKYDRGEILNRSVKTVVEDVFIDKENFWEHKVTNPTNKLIFEVIFNPITKPSNWKQIAKFGNSIINCANPVWDEEIHGIRWTIGTASVGEIYKLWWEM